MYKVCWWRVKGAVEREYAEKEGNDEKENIQDL